MTAEQIDARNGWTNKETGKRTGRMVTMGWLTVSFVKRGLASIQCLDCDKRGVPS